MEVKAGIYFNVGRKEAVILVRSKLKYAHTVLFTELEGAPVRVLKEADATLLWAGGGT